MSDLPLRVLTRQTEAQLVRQALEKSRGNVREAAARCGVSRSAMYRLLLRRRIGAPRAPNRGNELWRSLEPQRK